MFEIRAYKLFPIQEIGCKLESCTVTCTICNVHYIRGYKGTDFGCVPAVGDEESWEQHQNKK